MDMFPHDHPAMDQETALMGQEAKEMARKLDEVIKSPFPNDKDKNPPKLIDRIHAYMFVFDSSNKRTFQSMMCMIETINELEKSKKKGAGVKSGKDKKGN